MPGVGTPLITRGENLALGLIPLSPPTVSPVVGVGLWTPCQQVLLTVDLDLQLASAEGMRSLCPCAVAEAPS